MKVGDLVMWRDYITGETDNVLGLVFDLDTGQKALVHFVDGDGGLVWEWIGELEKVNKQRG